MTDLASNKPITMREPGRMKRDGEKIAMLTCHDASFAALPSRPMMVAVVPGPESLRSRPFRGVAG